MTSEIYASDFKWSLVIDFHQGHSEGKARAFNFLQVMQFRDDKMSALK